MNVEAKVTNHTTLHGLKTCLDKAKGLWPDELHSILWAYRMTSIFDQETLFNLAYGIKVVISLELGLLSYTVQAYDEYRNSKDLRANLDLLEEAQEKA